MASALPLEGQPWEIPAARWPGFCCLLCRACAPAGMPSRGNLSLSHLPGTRVNGNSSRRSCSHLLPCHLVYSSCHLPQAAMVWVALSPMNTARSRHSSACLSRPHRPHCRPLTLLCAPLLWAPAVRHTAPFPERIHGQAQPPPLPQTVLRFLLCLPWPESQLRDAGHCVNSLLHSPTQHCAWHRDGPHDFQGPVQN